MFLQAIREHSCNATFLCAFKLSNNEHKLNYSWYALARSVNDWRVGILVIVRNSPSVYLRQNSQFHHQVSLPKCALVNFKKNKLPRARDTKNNLVKTTRRWQRFEKNFV